MEPRVRPANGGLLCHQAGVHGTFFRRVGGGSFAQELARLRVPLGKEALDVGCGAGNFMAKLAARRLYVTGVDISDRYVSLITERMGAHPLFCGAVCIKDAGLPFASSSFDIVFMLDVIEHLLEDERTVLIGGLHRALKKGGHLIVTTPNDESLEGGKVLCPECGCIFHAGQHLSRWTAASLSALLSGSGFTTVDCCAITFHPPAPLNRIREWFARLRKEKKVNLLYVGRKDREGI